jgi:LuxR family maltose regulon positive regulatory protein
MAGLVEQLSERELAVLRYLPSSLSIPEIARELYVSPNTVKTQCSAIYRKLAVTNRQAAVQAAREQHLL